MNTRPLLLLAAVPGLLLTALALSLVLLFEEVEAPEQLPPGLRARSNPLLALEWTLDRLGYEATSHTELVIPEGTDAALIVLPDAGRLTRSEALRLLDWVAAGGVLVYSPPDFEDDPLLWEFALEMEPAWPEPSPEGVEGGEGAAEDPAADELAAEPPAAVAMELQLPEDAAHPAAGGAWRVQGEGVGWLRGEPLDWVAGATDAERFAIGGVAEDAGQVIFIADASPFINQHLGEAENANFAHDVFIVGQPTKIHLVYRLEQEGMLTLLLRLAWPAALSGLALLLAWIWLSSRRFGTIYADPIPERRSLAQHIDAVGAFAWRRGHAPAMVDRLRDSTLERLGSPPADPEARVRWLVQRTRCPEETVRLALSPLENDSPRALIELVRALEALRRSR